MMKTEKVQMLVDVTIRYNNKEGRKQALAEARDLYCEVAGAGPGPGTSFSAKSGRVRLVKPAAAPVGGGR